MAARRESKKTGQAWIELTSGDPEALSALGVARAQLAAGKGLARLRRVRVVELTGKLPERDRIETLLHGSTQFYNPHKERCALRLLETEASPIREDERVVLVFEREGERRPAAERWWLHETGDPVEVREGTAWVLAFEPGQEGDALQDLTLVRGRRHGLLCNPHSQDYRVAGERVPLPWLATETATASPTRPARRKPAVPPRSKK